MLDNVSFSSRSLQAHQRARIGLRMLHEFVTANRDGIIARCRGKIASRPNPRATDAEIEHGVPLFLDQLVDTLRRHLNPNLAIGVTATQHGGELLRSGFSIAQVVHDYGGICQAITELAFECEAAVTVSEFRALNMCLDEAIAQAVTEFSRLRDDDGAEGLGRLAHEMRIKLDQIVLAFEALQGGSAAEGTAGVLARSVDDLRNLIDRVQPL